MKVIELQNEEVYVLCAPDGSPQFATMAPEFPMCIAMCEMLARAGISQPLEKMFNDGFVIMPVKITMVQNGDENKPFKKKHKTKKASV